MITIYKVRSILTGYSPFSCTNPDEAQKYIDTVLKSSDEDWQVQSETVWASIDERDWALGIGNYAPAKETSK